MSTYNHQTEEQFFSDLRVGQNCEELFAKVLQKRGFEIEMNREGNLKQLGKYDFLARKDDKVTKVEVKHDLKAPKTGNVAIEFECLNKSEANIVVYRIGDLFYCLTLAKCMEVMTSKLYRKVSAYGCDNNITLVPFSDFKDLCSMILDMNGDIAWSQYDKLTNKAH
jgi:hypothetical protein